MAKEVTSRVLVVDDDPDAAKGVARAIRGLGREIEVMTDPLEAVDWLAREPVDLLISDVDMPGLSGYELIAAARDLAPRAIRMLVTGVGTIDGTLRAINEGEVHRYVLKPFVPKTLREQVAELLSRKLELDREASAEARARRARQLREQLEKEHPGVTQIEMSSDGTYSVDVARAHRRAAAIGLGRLFPSSD